MPNMENMLIDWPKISSEMKANGTVSGSESKMVIGCTQLSNCAARMRYMKTSDIANATRNADIARPCSRERPAAEKE